MQRHVVALWAAVLSHLGLGRGLPAAAPRGTAPLRIGVVSDIQYADTEDATNFAGSRVRRYRHSLEILAAAVRHFDDREVDLAVQLGDLLDGKAAAGGKESSRAALADVRRVLGQGRLGQAPGGWRSCVGNHELYNFDRWELAREDLYFEGAPEDNLQRLVQAHAAQDKAFDEKDLSPPLYYAIRPRPGWRLVFLDAYAESVIGDARGAWGRLASARRLVEQNPNVDASNPGKAGNWLEGITGTALRWVPYNGALGVSQLKWLGDELAAATAAAERVVIFSHQPFFAPATRNNNLPWDYDLLHTVVAEAGSTVAAVFAGHDHDGGYSVDAQGVHHIVPAAPLECDEGEMAFGYLDCFDDRIEMGWVGKPAMKAEVWPRTLSLAPLPGARDGKEQAA